MAVKSTRIIYWLAASLFWIAATVTIIGSHDSTMGVVWIAVGTLFAVLGEATRRPQKSG